MRRYETITIIDPDLSEEERRPVLERVEGLMPQQDGLLVEIDEWGARKLAYEIKKKMRGFYVRFDYCGTGELVNEIERFFRIDDRVLKYMTVLQEDQVDIDQIKAMIAAAAESKKEKPAPEAVAQTEPPASDTTETATADESETAAVSETETAAADDDETATPDEAGTEQASKPAEAEQDTTPEDESSVKEQAVEGEPAPAATVDPDTEATQK